MLDTDQNPNTGSPGIDPMVQPGDYDTETMGTDFVVTFYPSIVDPDPPHEAQVTVARAVQRQEGWVHTVVEYLTPVVHGDGYEVNISLEALGGDDGKLNYKVLTSKQVDQYRSTSVLDIMPDLEVPPGTSNY